MVFWGWQKESDRDTRWWQFCDGDSNNNNRWQWRGKTCGWIIIVFVAESVTSEADASALAVKSKLFCQTKPNTNKITEHLRRLSFYPKVGSALWNVNRPGRTYPLSCNPSLCRRGRNLYCYGLRFLVTMGSRPSIIARHGRYSHCHDDIFMDLFVYDFLLMALYLMIVWRTCWWASLQWS